MHKPRQVEDCIVMVYRQIGPQIVCAAKRLGKKMFVVKSGFSMNKVVVVSKMT